MFAHGRVPLAYSARCFTARRFNLQKDTCEFKCIDFPDGMTLKTREGDDFLSLNGIQTQSAKVYNLLAGSARTGRGRRRYPAHQPAVDGHGGGAGGLPQRHRRHSAARSLAVAGLMPAPATVSGTADRDWN